MKTTFTHKLKVAGLIYGITLVVSLLLFFLERNMSRPSGFGIVFGPFNYFHLVFEFGVNWGALLINLCFVIVLSLICLLSSRAIRWAIVPFLILWLCAGFFAMVYETELPGMGSFWNQAHRF